MNLDTNLVGRTIPNPYPSGGTWTIVDLEIHDGKLYAGIRWSDGLETSGTLAPGTALWDALERDYRNTRCQCESSVCRHHKIENVETGDRILTCEARATGRFLMEGLGRVCEDCASAVCANGGAQYIHLHQEEA
jgi:hypothetical protein